MRKIIAIGAFALAGTAVFVFSSFNTSSEIETEAKAGKKCIKSSIICPNGSVGYTCNWAIYTGSQQLCNNGGQRDCAPIIVCK